MTLLEKRRNMMAKSGGIDWKRVAQGMIDCTTSFEINENMGVKLAAYIFYGRTNLTNIVLPDNVTTIPNAAFMGCSGLTSINIPNTVTLLGNTSFANCTGLTSITIPSSVTKIDQQCFKGCSKLAEVIMERSTPPTLGNVNAFNSVASNMIIYVPDTSVSDYKGASVWSNFSDKIMSINDRPTNS